MFFSKIKTSMEKEIYEQPSIIKGIIEKEKVDEIGVPSNVNKIVLVASGSSYHCARFSSELLGEIAGLEARAIYSSEFLLKKVVPHDKGTLYIFITQSGETTDTIKALRRVNEGFSSGEDKYYLDTMCITNKENSTIWKETKYHINCHAGVETSIAATKSFTAQMMCALVVTLKIARNKGVNIDEYMDSLGELPDVIEKTLELRKKVHHLARLVAKHKVVVMLAEGISYAIAKEGALKIKETSYMNINAGIVGEFMHGHVASLNNKPSAIIFVAVNKMSSVAAENLNKIKDEYNPSIYIIGKDNKYISNFNISVDCKNEMLQMFSNAVICQMLALEIATRMHKNVDHPKGLKKVVR